MVIADRVQRRLDDVRIEASTFISAAEYGRSASVRSCARRRRAAATIFIAFVICCVFLTLRIRRRMSIVFAIDYAAAATAASAWSRRYWSLNSLIAFFSSLANASSNFDAFSSLSISSARSSVIH